VGALGGEAAHAETVAGVALVDIVGDHARYPAEDVGDVAADVQRRDVFLRHGGDAAGQGPGAGAGRDAVALVLAAPDFDHLNRFAGLGDAVRRPGRTGQCTGEEGGMGKGTQARGSRHCEAGRMHGGDSRWVDGENGVG